MNWNNAKAVAAIAVAAVIAGTATYLIKQSEINRLSDENQKLLARQEALAADAQAAQTAAQSSNDELERLRKDASDAMRLRGEVAQLRRQQNEARRQPPAPPKSAPSPSPERKGTTFTREQSAYVGYATPEAALQSIVWATMSGKATAEQIAEGLSPDFLNDPEAYQTFERNRKESQVVFKSVDMLTKKMVDENRVELKGMLNIDLGPDAPAQPPQVMVLPMVKVGNQWKLGSNPIPYEEKWDTEGQVQPFGQ